MRTKHRLFGKIFSALKPGGIFVNADQADGETHYFRQRYLEYWNEFLRRGPLNTKENAEILMRRTSWTRTRRLSVHSVAAGVRVC